MISYILPCSWCLSAILNTDRSMSMFKIFQCPQNSFKRRALSMTWHWAHLLSPCLTKCVCFFCTLKPPSLECWPSISLHDWQCPIIQESVKSELAQDKSVESSAFLPMGVRYIIFNCLWGTVWDFIIFQLLYSLYHKKTDTVRSGSLFTAIFWT